MKRVLVAQSFWGEQSNQFLIRHLRMLERQGALAAIAVLYPTLKRSWHGVPIVNLSDTPSALGMGRWFGRVLMSRVGFVPAMLARQPLKGFRRLLSSVKPDVVLFQYATTAAVLWDATESQRCDLFVHLHGHDTYEEMCDEGHRQRVVDMSGRALLICNSRDTLDRMAGWGVAEDRLVLKYMGVEVPARPPVRPVRDGVTILQLGRLVGFKGPEQTIRAFELACDRGLVGQLVLAGDGPLRDECVRLISESRWQRRIVRTGAIDWKEGRRLRRQADIYTQHNLRDPVTGQREAFGVSVVEAMAEALPVVGTRSGGIEETVIHDETGLLVDPGDVDGHAEALLLMARNGTLRVELGRRGWCRARDRFSIEQEERELLRILGLRS